ncbi:hypothetical protein [Streptomyces sp. AA1529]|uniref:hypothetical protein n=1 Tax=Streptomyces sp. AA1529 TaxID=1203257 RepID=UPI0002DC813D|nr:hypothetical protein [Streptomyces sp. AA1529]
MTQQAVAPPTEGTCERCKQTRPLFAYKPEHDCIDVAGLMRLDEAADWIDQIRDTGDRWCEARLDRFNRQIKLCIRCHDKERADEETYIKENQL